MVLLLKALFLKVIPFWYYFLYSLYHVGITFGFAVSNSGFKSNTNMVLLLKAVFLKVIPLWYYFWYTL